MPPRRPLAVLNPQSPLPLYRQLHDLLRQDIDAGILGPGARLPSEPALSRLHGIGRPTVRQATELLVQRGLVERRRGSGTFVRRGAPRVDLFSLSGTLSSFAAGGLTLETRLLDRVRLRAVPLDAENPFSGGEAFTFRRLGRVRRRPTLLEHVFLEPRLFPDLPRVPLAGVSLSRLVDERYHLRPTHAEQSFRATTASPRARAALGLRPTEPVLVVKRTLHFPGAPHAIYSEISCRTDDQLTFFQTIGAESRHD